MKTLLALVLSLACLPAFGATCKISEYRAVAIDSFGSSVQVALEPAVITQSVTYTTSAQSAAFNSATRFVRVICDAKAHFKITTLGTNATATDPYLPTDTAEYFGITPGIGLIIDFYDGTS